MPITSVFPKLTEMVKEKASMIASYEIRVISTCRQYIVGNTRGKFIYDTQYYNSLVMVIVGTKDGLTEEISERATGTDIIHDFSEKYILDMFAGLLIKVEQVLNAEPSPSGLMDVVIGAEAGGTIIHEAV
jgi:TldD protein